MASDFSYSEGEIGIVEAVETLSAIAELDLKSDVGVTQGHNLAIQGREIAYSTVHWLRHEEVDHSVRRVKEVYRVILDYLRGFYKAEESTLQEHHTADSIKDIMVLVGDAAQKIDKFASLRKGRKVNSVTELKEFQLLQDFYQGHIANRNKALSINPVAATKLTKRGAKISLARRKGLKSTVVDLDTARKDLDYELFFLRKEGGKRFYSPELIRNLKLVSDFGGHFGIRKGKDPLMRVKVWRDRVRHSVAKNLLQALQYNIDNFYLHYRRYSKMELAVQLNKMIMSLMLCANPRNLLRNAPVKSSTLYFRDFLNFLRSVLNTREYQKLMIHPPQRTNRAYWSMLELAFATCRALYSVGQGAIEIQHVMDRLVGGVPMDESSPHPIADGLEQSHKMLQEVLTHHIDGPLHKVLETLDSQQYATFDSLHQGNLPTRLYSVVFDDKRVAVLRIGSPTRQGYVDRVDVTEEFKGFVRAYAKETVRKKHLMFNLQDRTNWREYHRARALERLPEEGVFKRYLSVVTLTKDSDFYHQLAPHHELNSADDFKNSFMEQLTGDQTGFHFPPMVQRALTKKFLKQTMDGIHHVFFEDRNVLTRIDRLDFIEICYMFLQLKIIEATDPTSMSFTCKDGYDEGTAASVQLNVFLNLMNKGEITEEGMSYLRSMLHAPVLLGRERAIHPEVLQRTFQVIRRLEQVRNDATSSQVFLTKVTKQFASLYDTHILRQSVTRQPRATRSW